MTTRNWFMSVMFGLALAQGARTGFAAVETVSETYAGVGTYLQGGRRGVERRTFFSAQCVCPSVYAGKISSVQSNVIIDLNARWENNQFNGVNGLFYVEFESGLMVDIQDTVAGNHSLALVGDVEDLVTPEDAYRVRRHMTLADLFGHTNEVGLLAATNSDQADNIMIHVPELQETQTFYYRSEEGSEGWFRADDVPASNTVVFPEQGLILRRKGAGRITFFQHGAVKRGPLLVPILEGTNLVGTVKLKKNFKLAELNLYTGDPTTGFVAADNLEDADNVVVVNAVNSTAKTYFYSTNHLGRAGWFDEKFRSASRAVVPAGSAFYVLRKASHGMFHWSVPTGQ